MAWGCLAAPAQAQREGEGLDEAQRHVEQGQPERAAAVLLRLFLAGACLPWNARR
jgi:hypothetical protein